MSASFSPAREGRLSPGTESSVTEGPWEESDVSWVFYTAISTIKLIKLN